MHYTYVLQSTSDMKLYVDFTKDLKLRFDRHNNGFVKSTKYSFEGKMFLKGRLKSYLTGPAFLPNVAKNWSSMQCTWVPWFLNKSAYSYLRNSCLSLARSPSTLLRIARVHGPACFRVPVSEFRNSGESETRLRRMSGRWTWHFSYIRVSSYFWICLAKMQTILCSP